MTRGLLDQLRRFVTDELGVGDQLPSEFDLASRHGVSRSSVREALKALEQDGLVYSVRGKGRFVSPMGSVSVERPITRYESTTTMLEALGFQVTTIVLDVREGEATERSAELLDLAVGAPVIQLTRLRVADETPLVLSQNTLPRDALPGPIRHRDWSGSLTTALAGHGSRLTSSAARITAANLPEPLAGRYQLGGLDPWLLIEETSLTAEGRRVLHSLDYHRGDLIGFNVLRAS
ncbi:MAG: GntR family transcriptional regulator [Propionicimonas sp.]